MCVCCRNDPPGQATSTATQELLRIIESSPAGLPALDPVKDLHLRDIDLVERFQRLDFLDADFANYHCVHDPSFLDNVRVGLKYNH